MSRHGFTLIELLVVIAIIAILAAILFPVFAKAREKARQSSCLSNVKQLMVAVLSYAQDYDEMLPGYYFSGVTNTSADQWFEVLTPYMKNTGILVCPSANTVNPGYGWNYRWISYGVRDPAYTVTSLGELTAPSTTVILSDSNQYYVRGPSITTASYWPPGRHNEGANFGLADGHAKWYQVKQFENASGCLQWWP